MRKMYFKKIRDNIYLIIPMICIILWGISFLLIAIFTNRFSGFIYHDFKIFYECGKKVIEDPTQLYKYDYGYAAGYFYLPSFAMLMAVSISLLPYNVAYFVFYGINIIFAMILVRQFNSILVLVDVKKKIHRFMFLMIISNGFVIFNIFLQNQLKFIIGAILFFILRRELQWRKEEKEKDLKYNLVNLGLFIFTIAMAPYLIFLLVIYIFQDIRIKDIFKKDNVIIYGIAVLWFIAQNFLFIIYPSLIYDFLLGMNFSAKVEFFWLYYMSEWVYLSTNELILYSIFNIIVTIIITLILLSRTKLKVEEKFAYFAFCSLYYSLFVGRVLAVFLPLVLLLFIPFLKQDEKGFDFIKTNKILLIGLLAIIGIYFNVNPETLYIIFMTILPFLNGTVLMIFIYLRLIFLICIIAICFLLLNLKNEKTIEL